MPYFDYNATTPLTPAAREAWLNAQTEAWQNASSPHRAGVRVGLRLQAAREKIGMIMGCPADRVVFTGGATEAAHAIVQHLSEQLPEGARVAVNATEHPCVLGAVGSYFESDCVVRLPVDSTGVIDLGALEAALKEGVKAIVVMAVNNETGVLQPWAEIAELCHHAGVAFVCDACQWLGKLPAGGLAAADWVFGAAHKFGGPKGVGFLLRPSGDNGFSMRRGGGQEAGQRGGTEDFPGISAMVAALLEAEQSKVLHESDRLRTREAFEREIQRRLPGTRVVGAESERLWNTISLVMPHGENHRWVARLDKCQIQVSTGSACASGKDASSHVLAAMRVPGEEVRRVIRISVGWDTTPQEWQELANALIVVAPTTQPASAVISS